MAISRNGLSISAQILVKVRGIEVPAEVTA
jgi:hypothetical protein